MNPLCHGDPGSTNAVSTPAVLHHWVSAAAVNTPCRKRTLRGHACAQSRETPFVEEASAAGRSLT